MSNPPCIPLWQRGSKGIQKKFNQEKILSKDKLSVTSAVRFLRENRVDFIEHPYKYEEGGGTETAAKAFGVDEHLVIKTLVMEDDQSTPFIVLMH